MCWEERVSSSTAYDVLCSPTLPALPAVRTHAEQARTAPEDLTFSGLGDRPQSRTPSLRGFRERERHPTARKHRAHQHAALGLHPVSPHKQPVGSPRIPPKSARTSVRHKAVLQNGSGTQRESSKEQPKSRQAPAVSSWQAELRSLIHDHEADKSDTVRRRSRVLAGCAHI